MAMQQALPKETFVDTPADDVRANNSGNRPFTKQQHPSRWHRLIDALHWGRMGSAQREIKRHQDAILFWRRGLAERKAHLRAVSSRTARAANAVAYRVPGGRFGAFGTQIGRGFINMRAMVKEWRRRILRCELLSLNDVELRDIRWTRSEAQEEARKPFWRA